MKILALDFDGVIVDSEIEGFACMNNAYSVFNTHQPRPFKVWDIRKIPRSRDYKAFTRIKPFFSQRFGYFHIMKALEAKSRIKSQEDYDDFCKTVKPLNDFAIRFHNERKLFQKQDFCEWMKAIRPNKKVIAGIAKIAFFFDKVIIVTSNKKELISPALKKMGLSVDAIYDHYDNTDKMVLFKQLYPKNDIYFIDDSLFWMERLKDIGVKCFLATWGYNTAGQRIEARKRGVILLREEDIAKKLK